MAFFSKRETKTTDKRIDTLKVADVKVATTTITSSYKTDVGLRCVKWYFLVREENEKYYEIFSNKQIEKESDTHHDGFTFQTLDTPYIEKLEPLNEYLKNSKKVVKLQLLFDFILNMNVQERLAYFDNIKK